MKATKWLRPLSLAALALTGIPHDAHAAGSEEKQIEAALAWAGPMLGEHCDFMPLRKGDLAGSRYFEIRFRLPGQDQDEADKTYPLVQLPCASRPPNRVFVYLTRDGRSAAYRLLSFAEPKLEYDYADEDFARLQAPPRITGYVARSELFNPEFDPATNTIHMRALWRAKGDAWSSGTWQFTDGEFVLKEYSIDPTFDTPDGAAAGNARSGGYQIYPVLKPIPAE